MSSGQTPDRSPFNGPSDEEGMYLEPDTTMPQRDGEVRYVTGSGFWCQEEGVVKPLLPTLTGSALNDEIHRLIPQLTHFVVDETTYDEITRGTNGRVTMVTTWDSPTKNRIYRQDLISRVSNHISEVISIQNDLSGSLVEILSESIVRDVDYRVSAIIRTRTT